MKTITEELCGKAKLYIVEKNIHKQILEQEQKKAQAGKVAAPSILTKK